MSLRLGDIAPNFKAQTTVGEIDFMNIWVLAGAYSFLILLIIHRFVPPN